jgi:hypothetical protein
MPTGYTSIIEDGNPTFKEYALRCARAFGAFVHMREEPLNAPLRLRDEPDGHYEKKLSEAKARLAKLSKLEPKDVQKDCAKTNAQRKKDWAESEEKRIATMAKYDTMATKVMAYQPPTPDHNHFKEFMLDQIRLSTAYMNEPRPFPEMLTPKQHLDSQINSAKWDVEYYSKQVKEERERESGRNDWAKKLMESLERQG